MSRPAVLLFDVNETLIDIDGLRPLFERVFGDGRVLREWFAQLVIYSQTNAHTGGYLPFGALGAGALRMLGTIHGRSVSDGDTAELSEWVANMPAHPGVADALARLRDQGFRLATLTNSAPTEPPTTLEKAGLAPFFEASYSVAAVRRFKPAPECYRYAAGELGVELPEICMVAAHIWDLLGAQALGCRTAFVSWADNALLPVPGLPQPDVNAPTMIALAEEIIRRWPRP